MSVQPSPAQWLSFKPTVRPLPVRLKRYVWHLDLNHFAAARLAFARHAVLEYGRVVQAAQAPVPRVSRKKSTFPARRGSLFLLRGDTWQSLKQQFENAREETTQTAIVHAVVNLGRLCVADNRQHAQLVKDGLMLR